MANVLLLDDEQHTRRAIDLHLRKQGHIVSSGGDGREGLDLLGRDTFDLIITDLRMPRVSGLELLKTIREQGCQIPVIVLTAFTSIESAVEAMKLGASDYIGKPPQLEEITIKVNQLLEHQALVEENRRLKRAIEERFQVSGVVGRSRAICQVIDQVKLLARDPGISILLTGESGTGKELIARVIHFNSPRARGPFVAINCGALPEALLESELFGHEKGAFTGAGAEKKGLLEVAHRGTLFLDEISAMPPAMQVKLLRALEEKEIRRLGGTRNISVDIRIVSASNQDLEKLVHEKSFRQDLFYRLCVASVTLPSLAEREGDVRLLANHFLEKFNREKNKSLSLSSEAVKQLESYAWPGNVRELEHLIELMVVTVPQGEIEAAHLPTRITSRATRLNETEETRPEELTDDLKEASRLMTARFERDFIARQLEKHHWNVTRTAQAIGISRAALHSKMKDYGLANI
ncbi:MAG TPA: sigma-54 dependent transcriptional regulator [Blastocatellia bacterium]|jgi:DNA-binding NtrC family response regulator|nr:sigma-54 dependent transcriptional regulator [Blastocatellia bacterium]